MFEEEEMLMLSGIQHFVFCPRQWALIHMDGYWNDNVLTTEGSLLHTRVDNPAIRIYNNNVITTRQLHIASKELGLYGLTDAVEWILTKDERGINLPKYKGRFIPYPIEYKRGKPKQNPCDKLQLTAQILCLEEMYHTTLNKGALFYWETRHREDLDVDEELKTKVKNIVLQMHEIFASGNLPRPEYNSSCKRCSLFEKCQPKIEKTKSAISYLKKIFNEETA